MRPVKRGGPPRSADFTSYRDATPDLISRLGPYCSYCERQFDALLAVEHVQPKAPGKYPELIGRWDNFLLACVNCNASKGDKDVDLAELFLPDRDNTFIAFTYLGDGTVKPMDAPADRRDLATQTLALVGLDRQPQDRLDANGEIVALSRTAQRNKLWEYALSARSKLARQPGNRIVREFAIDVAKARGFFSIWMTVFANDRDMRNRLIDAFPSTRASGCFDPVTTEPITPAPNPDGLPHGSKI